MNTVQN